MLVSLSQWLASRKQTLRRRASTIMEWKAVVLASNAADLRSIHS
jgi:hypothetical protein